MESFKRRLKYYGIGFGFGLLFVFFFFQNRGCSWLPANRVKNGILDRVLVVSDETSKKLQELKVNVDDLIDVLNDGDVLFQESDKDHESKVYLIEKDDIKYAFTLPYEGFVSEVFVDVSTANVPTTKEGMGTMIYFPNDEHLVYPDSTAMVTCQQEQLGLINPKDILEQLKKTGKIDFAKSDFSMRPKPLQYLTFSWKGDLIGIKSIWYKNKVNITSFESEVLQDCD